MTSVTSLLTHEEALNSSELPPMRREDFYTLDTQGEITSVGCELLLGVKDPRSYLETYGLTAKKLALDAGIQAASSMQNERVSINIDGDLATPAFIWEYEQFRNLPQNIIFELTEVKKISEEALLMLMAIASKNKTIFIDDMPTTESMHNLTMLLKVMETIDIDYGVKVDFLTTHALLGRPFKGDKTEEYAKAIYDMQKIEELLRNSQKKPTWLIFEGLHFEDELHRITKEFAPLLDTTNDPDKKTIVLGQFFRNEIKRR